MKKVEFLIVGNGLAGTLLAFEMLQHNLDFRIVSSPQMGGASEVAAGMFNPLVFKRLTKSWLADELLPVMKKKYGVLENLLENRFLFEKDILKPLSEQEKQLWIDRKSDPEFSKYIVSVENVSPVNFLAPAAGYGRVKGAGYVNLKLFLQAAHQFFEKNKLVVHSTFDFNKINPKAKYVETADVQASKIVFCEGAWLAQNPFFLFIKLVRTKGEILLIHAPGLSEQFILNKQVFVLPVGNKRFKAGSTYDWNDLTDRPTEKGKLSITGRLDKLISSGYKIENHVAGIRPAMSDRRPVLGIHPEYRNLSVFNGLGTKGVMLAPYFAHEMLQVLMSDDFAVNQEVDINRFLK